MRTSTLCVSMAGLMSGSWKKSYSKLASPLETGSPYSRRVASLEQSTPKKPCPQSKSPSGLFLIAFRCLANSFPVE